MNRYTILLIVLVLSIALFDCFHPEPELNCPNFKLRDLDGNIVEFQGLLEEGPVMISVWALWCKVCIKGLDALNEYHSELASYNITILAISQDRLSAIPAAKPFVEENDREFTVLYDLDNRIRPWLVSRQCQPVFYLTGSGTSYLPMWDTNPVKSG